MFDLQVYVYIIGSACLHVAYLLLSKSMQLGLDPLYQLPWLVLYMQRHMSASNAPHGAPHGVDV